MHEFPGEYNGLTSRVGQAHSTLPNLALRLDHSTYACTRVLNLSNGVKAGVVLLLHGRLNPLLSPLLHGALISLHAFIDHNERAPVRHRCRGSVTTYRSPGGLESCAGAVDPKQHWRLGFTTQELGRWSSAAVQCYIRRNAVMFWKAEKDGAYPPYRLTT